MNSSAPVGRLSVTGFLVFWAITFGAVVRLIPAILSKFPINDGGLFYVMVQDLLQARYVWPLYTTYNAAQIPFAYPPLAFYLTAFLANGSGIPVLAFIRWIPPLVTVLTIPAFYLLARAVLKSARQAALASVAFAMVPRAFDLFVFGGGLTRSFGALFSLLTLYGVYQLYTTHRHKYLWLSILWAALLICSHPETAFHTVVIVGLLWIVLGRDRKSVLSSLLIALGVLVLTAPWWGTVVARLGWGPFRSILQSGWHNWLFWTPLVTLNFSGERYLGIVMLMGVIGFLAALVRREYLLVLWVVIPFPAEPRNPSFSAMVPLSMLAAIGFDQVILPGMQALQTRLKEGTTPDAYLGSAGARLLLFFFLIYALINAFSFSVPLAALSVSAEEQKAAGWIQADTPSDARFVLLTYGDPFNTPMQEWFPALTKRVSLTTVQGYEWLPGKQLYQRKRNYEELVPCLFHDVSCVEQWAQTRDLAYDYVYVYEGITAGGYSPASSQGRTRLGGLLIQSMHQSEDYALVYQSEMIKVFAHRRSG